MFTLLKKRVFYSVLLCHGGPGGVNAQVETGLEETRRVVHRGVTKTWTEDE